MNNMASLLNDMGRLKEAEALYKRAWEAKERTLGPDHPSTLDSVNNMALLLQDMGKLSPSARGPWKRRRRPLARTIQEPSTLSTTWPYC